MGVGQEAAQLADPPPRVGVADPLQLAVEHPPHLRQALLAAQKEHGPAAAQPHEWFAAGQPLHAQLAALQRAVSQMSQR